MSAAYEDEKPTRELTGWVRHVVAAGCVLVGPFAVYQVSILSRKAIRFR
jgi:hypothetical protein